MEKDSAKEIIAEMKKEIEEEDFRQKHVKDAKRDFIRNRKLNLSNTMLYVLGNTRQMTELAAEDYCAEAGIESLSAAAVCKARAKIEYTAFEALFEKAAQKAPQGERYLDYQVIAVDGMKGEMPKTSGLMGVQQKTRGIQFPQFHAIAAYDILNDIFLAADFLPSIGDERKMAIALLDHSCFAAEKQILLFDRGFPSVALIQKLNTKGKKFVMRVSSSFLKEVNAFTKSKAVDRQITIHYNERRGATNRVQAQLPAVFDLRCLRIHLSSGEDEICITNLERETFPKRSIKHLYCSRWNIETSFNYLKNAIFIEEFSSKKENGIKQDFYASLWAANLVNVLLVEGLDFPLKKNDKIGLSPQS